jgi:hypothetical protein
VGECGGGVWWRSVGGGECGGGVWWRIVVAECGSGGINIQVMEEGGGY